MKPLIGVTCRRMDYGLESWMTPQQGALQSMLDAVVRAGGAPVLIPLVEDTGILYRIYQSLDGVLLIGGGDVSPRLYGEKPEVPLLNPDDLLDRVEVPLVRWAAADVKPLFGICRGHQIINVALGGKLYQDVRAATGTAIEHNESWLDHKYDKLIHEITIAPDSHLIAQLGTKHLNVNSLHHQAVKKLGTGLKVVATAPDGVIEAVEGTGHQYVMGVQSHPEHVAAADARWQRVFNGFVDAARSRGKQPTISASAAVSARLRYHRSV